LTPVPGDRVTLPERLLVDLEVREDAAGALDGFAWPAADCGSLTDCSRGLATALPG